MPTYFSIEDNSKTYALLLSRIIKSKLPYTDKAVFLNWIGIKYPNYTGDYRYYIPQHSYCYNCKTLMYDRYMELQPHCLVCVNPATGEVIEKQPVTNYDYSQMMPHLTGLSLDIQRLIYYYLSMSDLELVEDYLNRKNNYDYPATD